MSLDRSQCRRWIARLLWIGGGLTLVLFVAGIVWAMLSLASDDAGSGGAKGVFLTTLALWCLNFIGLVVVVALCQLVDFSKDEDRSAASGS